MLVSVSTLQGDPLKLLHDVNPSFHGNKAEQKVIGRWYAQ